MPDRPSDNELERFLLGTLPPADAVRVSEWVSTAPEAIETLRALSASDAFTDSLKVVARATRSNRAQLSTSSPGPIQTLTQTHVPGPVKSATVAFPPAELGGFRIVRELGRGGMGAVFEATDSALGRKVALKVMLPEVAVHPQARERFLREARAAARVEHESIVPIYQIGEANGMPYITMPLLAGESLDTRLKPKNPLPLGDLILVGRQVAEGLAAAHAGGLIHRDIKPSNIWLDLNANGSVRRVRILDFGLARAPGDAVLTGAGDILGTPAYMSVEQARGQLVDFRTDLYSLGVVLYQAATGHRPFDGGTAYAVLAALAVQTPLAPAQVNPAVPSALSVLIVKLMNKTPAGRPQSARAVIEELARIAAPWKTAAPAAAPGTGTKPSPALGAVLPVPLPRPTPPIPALDTISLAVEAPSTLPDAPDPVPDPEPLPLDAGFSVEVTDVTELFRSEPEAAPPSRPRWKRVLLIAIGVLLAAWLLIASVLVIAKL